MANFLGLLSIDVWKFLQLHTPCHLDMPCHELGISSLQKGYLKVMAAFFETTNDGRYPAPTEMFFKPFMVDSSGIHWLAGFLNHQHYDVHKKRCETGRDQSPKHMLLFLGGNPLWTMTGGATLRFSFFLQISETLRRSERKTPFWQVKRSWWALAWYEKSWLI